MIETSGCLFCGNNESPDIKVCSRCVSKILEFDETQITAAIDLAEKQNRVEAVEYLKTYKEALEDERRKQSYRKQTPRGFSHRTRTPRSVRRVKKHPKQAPK